MDSQIMPTTSTRGAESPSSLLSSQLDLLGLMLLPGAGARADALLGVTVAVSALLAPFLKGTTLPKSAFCFGESIYDPCVSTQEF